MVSAIAKLARSDESGRQFTEWGYPSSAFYMVAAIELLGAAGLLIPKTAQSAAGLLILVCLGAIYTQFSRGTSLAGAAPAVLLLAILSFIVLLRRRERSAVSL